MLLYAICIGMLALSQADASAPLTESPAQFEPAPESAPPDEPPDEPREAPPEASPEDADPAAPAEEAAPSVPERFGPPVDDPDPRPVEEHTADDALLFPCEQLDYLWTGPHAADAGAGNDHPRSLEEAAYIYAEYLRHLFLSEGPARTCEIAHDPIITLANAGSAVARGRGSVTELARVIGRGPESVQALWLLDAIVRYDRAFAPMWQHYFGPGPAFRIIDLLFDELPRGGAPIYQALLSVTESAHGVYADYIAHRFIGIFANSPQWVLLNAERLIPFGPALRLIFCNYLSIPEREALVLRYGEFPYSDAQAAVIELIACL